MVIAQSAGRADCAAFHRLALGNPLAPLVARSMSSFQRSDSVARRATGADPQPAARVIVSVVSGDPELASACARVLGDAGYAVHTAMHSGHALLACLQGRRTDLLIAELSMDEGSGPALARRMRKYNPDLRALYIAKEGTVCDAENVLVRPFTREDLVERVARVISS